MSLPFAEEMNYWKTSRTAADAWLDKAEALIESYGGAVDSRAIGRHHGSEAVMLGFRFGADVFRLTWPCLPSKYGDTDASFAQASRRQAATSVYHDVKSRGIRFKIAGARVAFFEFQALPDGRVAGELAAPDLLSDVPKMLAETTS